MRVLLPLLRVLLSPWDGRSGEEVSHIICYFIKILYSYKQ